MLNPKNPHFLEMKRIGHEYEERRAAHQAKKQTIADTYGYDSPEMKAWYSEKEEFPFTSGQHKAYRAWAESIARQEDELEMTESCFESEYADFIATLRAAGIESMVVTSQSTGLMSDLYSYAALGCTMQGLYRIARHEERWGKEGDYEVRGIRFLIN